MNNDSYDILVIGGGVTALSAAEHAARQGLRTAIVAPQLDAGLVGNNYSKGFYFDFGGHVYTVKDPYVLELLKEAGAEIHTDRRAAYVHSGDKLISYPVQDFANEMGIELFRSGNPPLYRENLEQYLIRELGSAFYYQFMERFNSRVWTCHPSKMDSDWVYNRVKLPSEKKEGWGVHYHFAYARGDVICDVMIKRLKNLDVALLSNQSIVSVNPGYAFNHKLEKISAEFVVDTTRMHEVGSVNRVYSIGIGFNRPVEDENYWYYCNLNSEIHRVNILSKYHTSLAPDRKGSVLIEIPLQYASSPYFMKHFDSQRSRYHDHAGWYHLSNGEAAFVLQQAGIPSLRGFSSKDIETAVLGVCVGYPIPTYGIRNQIAELKESMFSRRHLFAGRWGSHGYFNLDHAMHDGRVAVDVAVSCRMNDEYLFSTFYYSR